MSGFAIDDDLRIGMLFVCASYILLQFFYDRASSIENGDVIVPGDVVCGRRFAMCPKEDAHVMQSTQVVIINCFEPELFQSIDLKSVVYDVSQHEKWSVL